MSGPNVLVTRPAHQARGVMTALGLRGFTPIAAPVLEMRTLEADIPADFDALAFTSANGVAAFTPLSRRRDVPVFAVGEATAAAARAAGFSFVAAAEGRLSDLAPLIAARLGAGARLLHPSGRDVAGELDAALPGISVTRVPLYAMEQSSSLPDEALTALAAPCAVLLYSARSATAFGALAGDVSRAVAVTFSDQVGAAARAFGFREVAVSLRPDEAALLDCLETVKGGL